MSATEFKAQVDAFPNWPPISIAIAARTFPFAEAMAHELASLYPERERPIIYLTRHRMGWDQPRVIGQAHRGHTADLISLGPTTVTKASGTYDLLWVDLQVASIASQYLTAPKTVVTKLPAKYPQLAVQQALRVLMQQKESR